MIEIRFHKSTAKRYKEVLKHCRRFPYFTEGDPNVLHIPDADTLYPQWEDFNLIIHNVKRWAGCTVSFNGKPLAPYKVLSEWFYAIQNLKYCYFTFYNETYDKQSYCNDGGCWGCKNLKSIFRYILPSFWPLNYWYIYGQFVSKNAWRINKEQIRAVLLEEAAQKYLDFCPAFSPGMIDPFLNELPDTITVDGVNWKVRYMTDYLENGPVEIPVGIEHTSLERDDIPRQDIDPEHEIDRNILSDKDADRLIDEYLKRKEK